MNEQTQPMQTSSGSALNDNAERSVLVQTIARLQSVIQSTATTPHIRAHEIQRVKSEYLKTKYNVDLKIQ